MFDTKKSEYKVVAFWEATPCEPATTCDVALIGVDKDNGCALIADMQKDKAPPYWFLKNVRVCKLYSDITGNYYIRTHNKQLFFLAAYWFDEKEPPYIYKVIGKNKTSNNCKGSKGTHGHTN